MDKTCKECKSSFTTNRGTQIFCSKYCRHKNWVKNNREWNTLYKKNHYQSNKERYKLNAEEWKKKNQEWSGKYYKEYYNKNSEKILGNNYRWRSRNREKVLAHGKVKREISAGRLTRSPICNNCGTDTKTEAHHSDYSEQTGVIWLCRRCHKSIHKLNN